tara:strand:- start:247 stop:1011 length:765 start_codon:yes stop_codon:yes gene_type:complete
MNFLIIGCSNGLGLSHILRNVFSSSRSYFEPQTEDAGGDQVWYDDRDTYTNLSAGGAGNRYITNRLFEYISCNEKPDYIYLQFSGLHRIDLPTSQENIFDQYAFQTKTEHANWIHSGGMNGSWLGDERCQKMFTYLYDPNDQNHVTVQNLFEINNALNFLNRTKIPYNWSTYYDYCNAPNEQIKLDGVLNESTKKIYETLDNTYKIQTCLTNHIMEKNKKWMENDDVHWKYDGGMDWLNYCKKQFIIRELHAAR